MSFVEPAFLVFFLLTFAVYWAVRGPQRRQDVLLVSSLVFYGWWDFRFLLLLGFVVGLSWYCAQRSMLFDKDEPERRTWIGIGIAANLAVLALFRYFGFFSDSTVTAITTLGLTPSWPMVNLIVPLGLSFYILQAISYLIDTARGDVSAEPKLRRVAFYISFFPQLAAGPIVRAKKFFPQMDRPKHLSSRLFFVGARAFALGLAYKVGIADHLASFVDPVFGAGDAFQDWSNGAVIGASLAFSAQIYFDFAGYSLMAIGIARWFGYLIPRNFDYPYASLSIDAFWRRWHMSLSAWLRDYIYVPLGGDRSGDLVTYRNVMVTVLLGALWHGAAWTFIAWGMLHGAALCLHRFFFRTTGLVASAAIGLAVTQTFVLLAWTVFRAEDFDQAIAIWQAFSGGRDGGALTLPWTVWLAPGFIILDAMLGNGRWALLGRRPIFRSPLIYWSGLGGLSAVLLAFFPMTPSPFVYFQF